MGKMSNELSVFTFNKYGNNPINRGDIALQGEWIYQYQDKKIYKTNIFTKKRKIITNADCVYNLNVILC